MFTSMANSVRKKFVIVAHVLASSSTDLPQYGQKRVSCGTRIASESLR
jgi:hypothetical protein